MIDPDRAGELIIPMVGAGGIMLYLLHVAVKTGWLETFLKNLDKPSSDAIKKQSDEMRADMDRNVADRKARQDR
ncbi:hypothetical protein ACI48D_08785 [Massilia sp. LXY-6]|uniref:hypothetical protein n=1 Tax=Massilia sp. LXY-6 TaxID=3379823 RepID=UPI003EE2F2C3